MSKQLIIRPEARTATVESLVGSVLRGQVRIPSFQRPLKWEAIQVLALFDSIYKGYPIGSLLLLKKSADADNVVIGPLHIKALAMPDALWIIDGQQRLTSLAAGLARSTPVPTTPDDPFIVYFDAQNHTFNSPKRNGVVPTTWVPVAQLLDASGLLEWMFTWQHNQDSELRTAVFETGTRLREYQVPLYTIQTDDEEVLGDIFYRTNTSGMPMTWDEVHTALFSKPGEYPSTLSELSKELAIKRMGQPTEQQLLTSLLAFEGLDPTRNLAEHQRRGGNQELNKLQTSVRDSLSTFNRVLDFLRNDAEIPHLDLLARIPPFAVLTRYFRLFPQPSSRSVQLLVRWTWRALAGAGLYKERTLLRHGVTSLQDGNDEAQAQKLLRLVPSKLPEQLQYQLPGRFYALATETRLALCAMYQQQPLNEDGQLIELGKIEAIQKNSKKSWPTIISTKNLTSANMPLAFGPANRILLPDNKLLLPRLMAAEWKQDADFLNSHSITPEALDALQKQDATTFLRLRGEEIERLVRLQSGRLAAWGQPDRISISQLVAQTVNTDLTNAII